LFSNDASKSYVTENEISDVTDLPKAALRGDMRSLQVKFALARSVG
jgi:hypothetical protein